MSSGRIILGIVAEYDPFHNGHAYHLSRARETVRPDTVYTVLSPCLKQRGTLSMLSPYDRAACALHAGSDAVFAMPVLWTVRDAEHYALGAVSLLSGMGITHIAFGAETPDMAGLNLAADFLETPPSRFQNVLKSFMEEGMGYPAALSRAVSSFLPGTGELLGLPNNILGICYLRALKRLKSGITPVVIPRKGNYHDSVISRDAPSASALREALYRGNYIPAMSAMPRFSAEMTRRAFLQRRIPDFSVWDALLLNCLRYSDLASLPDVSEGLDDAVKKAAAVSSTAEELTARLSGKRYTSSRISRFCAMSMLGVSNERLRSCPLPDAALLMALRRKNVPTDQWKDLPVRIVSSGSEWMKLADAEDRIAWKLWSMCCHLPDTLPFTERVYTE